jgi:DNA-binding CsgD family transcriptional regulator
MSIRFRLGGIWKEERMGIRNAQREELLRLEAKTLDARFLTEVREGLNCSPFEAEAVLGVVREVYFPFLDEAGGQAPPGKVTLVAVDADEPAGKSVAACRKVTVCLTVHRGAEDDAILQQQGPAALRQARIPELCQEALSQGGLLTAEDLAYRVFFVTPRTISRDLAALRQAEPGVMIPMRSTVHDLGPVLTHRTEIVRLALSGKTTSEICMILRHSPRAVANYLSTFVRCVQLHRKGMQVGQIAFLLRRGPKLVERYLELLAACEQDKNFAYHLDELMRLGAVGGENGATGGCHG